MKAIHVSRFGGPEVLALEDAPAPEPGSGQALVRVKAAGVNPVDAYMRSGAYPRKPELPYVPGLDAAGVVEKAGPGSRWRAGQRVYAAGTLSGAYAELALCADAQLHPLPEKVSFAQGAALGVPYGTAYRALFQRGRGTKGETVLVHGASGGVGTAALQLCRWKGLRAAGTAGTSRGLELARAQGAEKAVDHKQAGYEQDLLAWTGGKGFDLVVEMLANVNLARDVALLAPRGRVVVVGSRGSLDFDPRAVMSKDADVLGMSLFNAGPEELSEAHRALGEGLASGALAPVIAAELSLAQAARAHDDVMRAGAHGKIVLLP